MATESFSILYDGPALREGRMDARDLSEALLGLDQVCLRANDLLNGEQATVHLHLSSQVKVGSFEVLLELYQEISETLFGESVVSPRQILDYLGLTAAAVAGEQHVITSLVELWKLLQGERPKVVEEDSKDTTVTIEAHGENHRVDQNVYNFYGDVHIHNEYPRILEPVTKPGVEKWQSLQGGQVVSEVTRDEVEYFKPRIWLDEEVTEEEDTVTAEIVSFHFWPGYKWRFYSESRGKFTANMKDERFLRRVQQRQERFAYGDWLRFRMASRSVESEDGSKVEHDILKVVDVMHSPRQSSILSGEP